MQLELSEEEREQLECGGRFLANHMSCGVALCSAPPALPMRSLCSLHRWHGEERLGFIIDIEVYVWSSRHFAALRSSTRGSFVVTTRNAGTDSCDWSVYNG